jgi:small subunit ribosomal protein S6
MSKQRKNLYEGMYILSATLSEEARQKALEKITLGITGRQGEIHKMFDQGRKKMAYEINGKREGYYYLLYFSVPTPVMAEIWKEYHLNEDLLRFLNLRVEKVPEKIEFKPLIQE